MRAPDRLGVAEVAGFPRWAWLTAGVLHVAVLAVALLRWSGTPLPPPLDPIEVVVINRPPQVAGGAPPVPASTPTPAPLAARTAGAEPVPEPAPAGVPHTRIGPAKPPPPKPVQARQAPPSPTPGPGDALMDNPGTDNILLGENLLPATPDAAYPNEPPRYPPLAKAMGEAGLVVLLLHIDPLGQVSGVDMVASSGWPMLDRAAEDALAKWRFKPMPGGGSYQIRLRFRGPGEP